jgi:GT2 family glycosyltransferase
MNHAAAPLRLAIGIATFGRPDSLAETLRELTQQTRPPDRIVVAHVAAADVAGVADRAARAAPITFLLSPPGLARQRNAILDAVTDCDVLLFLDDDFLPAPSYIAATLAMFGDDPGVVMTTGRVLADGARGPGISAAAARAILAGAGRAPPPGPPVAPTFNGYGCNMALRLDVMRRHALRFDERLPLYGWYEDIDLSRRLARHGRVVALAGAAGVHLGVKGGRTSGRRLGYSQVVNPLYLWRKGSYPFDRALRSVGRHMLVNGVRALRPEPWVDRRGRLAGNALAVLDLLRGRAAPERILDL